MTSEIRTNSLKSRAGLSTVTFTDSGPMFSGITTFVDNSGFNIGTGSSIFSPATNTFTLGTNSAERLRIDAGGGMQLGTSTATASKLTVYGANDAAAIFQGSGTGTGAGNGLLVGNNGGTTGLLWNYENGNTLFATNNIERLRITSTGKVNIGDTQMSQNIFNIEDGTAAALDIASHGSGGDTAYIGVKKSDGGGLTIGISNRDIIFKTGATYSSGTVFDSGNEKVRIKANGTVNIGTNNQASGDSSSKLRVGTAAGSDVAVCVMGSGGTTTPALYITNWNGSQASNKSIIHFDNSGWGSHQIGSLAGSDGFGIYDDSVLRMSINNVGNTTFHTTGHIVLPSGTTAQRVNTTAALRFNSSLGNLEFYDGSSWKRVRLLEAAPTTGLLAYWPFSTASRSGSTYNDVSGNNHHLTVNGTITDDTTETKFSGCIDFGTADGNHYLRSSSNSFVNISSSSGYSGVSISVWVKTGNSTTNQWIISEGAVNSRWNYFVESANAPKWRSTNTGDIIQSGNILDNNWHHLVVTYNSSNNLVQHYRDGSFINQGTTTNPSFNGEYLLVGQHSSLTGNTSSYRWRGKMAHMRIYNRVLSSSDVSTLYQQW